MRQKSLRFPPPLSSLEPPPSPLSFTNLSFSLLTRSEIRPAEAIATPAQPTAITAITMVEAVRRRGPSSSRRLTAVEIRPFATPQTAPATSAIRRHQPAALSIVAALGRTSPEALLLYTST